MSRPQAEISEGAYDGKVALSIAKAEECASSWSVVPGNMAPESCANLQR
jgi:hypothetical protein